MKQTFEYQTNVERFEDLVFVDNAVIPGAKRAACMFSNGYGLSVINGNGAYCDKDTFEVAVLHDERLTYSTPLTDDVMVYISPSEITEIMQTVKGWVKDQYE